MTFGQLLRQLLIHLLLPHLLVNNFPPLLLLLSRLLCLRLFGQLLLLKLLLAQLLLSYQPDLGRQLAQINLNPTSSRLMKQVLARRRRRLEQQMARLNEIAVKLLTCYWSNLVTGDPKEVFL